MATSFRDYLKRLPPEEQLAVESGGRELIAEEASLRDIRSARHRSQVEIAEKLGVNQAAVSKMERRTDMYVSTLRDYVQAMGGELEIVVRFPDSAPIKIDLFRTLEG